MKAVIQRVQSAKVEVDNQTIGAIEAGLLVLLGVENGDTPAEVQWLAEKIGHLRIFEDAKGKMNDSVKDTAGSILIVSQFTLLADCRRGRRPAFTDAADPELANRLYIAFQEALKGLGISIETGKFGADMRVTLVNDGPVTIILERSPNQK
ncbi:MAG: D-aminoacyl-tRNA deacylase [Planctomycetota bacterium]|nr:D-aminoacyl-tRNA deacylase [Planctomycetota bacterium]